MAWQLILPPISEHIYRDLKIYVSVQGKFPVPNEIYSQEDW
jgi:hypothetical protein